MFLSLLPACALDAPRVDDVLAADSPGPAAPLAAATVADGARLQADLDATARAAVAAAEAQPADVALALHAARTLFQAADLRMQRASLEIAQAAKHLNVVLGADDAVGGRARSEILGLCTAGLVHAERAATAHAQSVDARLQVALHVSLIAWANGPTRALMAGYGNRLAREAEAAVQLDPAFDSAGPLRLLGRFRGKAPWPVGDQAQAKESLTRAVELAPIALNWLFLGDVLEGAGDRAGARAAWEQALTAPADASTAASLPWHRELARRRLALSGG